MTERFGGDWWLPGRDDSPTKGTLEISDNGEMSLELLGTITGEDGGWLSKDKFDLEHSRVHPLVHGVGRGSTFTLLDCFQTKSSLHLPAGTSSEVLHVGRTLRGAHLTAPDLSGFTSIWFEIDGMVEWMAGPGVSYVHTESPSPATQSLTIAVRPAESVRGPGGESVTIRHTPMVSAEGRERALLVQGYTIGIESVEPCTIDSLLAYASDLQDLVSIGTGATSGFRRVHACHPGFQVKLGDTLTDQPIEVLAKWTVPRQVGPLSALDVVFTHAQFGEAKGLEGWFRAASKHRRSLDRVMATRYAKDIFVTDRLMNYAAAIEAFDQVDHPDPKRGRRIEYRTRLARCASEAGEPFARLVGDRGKWVAAFKKARDDVAHHRPAMDDSPTHYYLAESAYWLYTLCLLRTANAPSSVLDAIVEHRSCRWLARRIEEAIGDT